jgi:hypothetical protein
MTPENFIEILDSLSRLGYETICNYEIIVSGHPGEYGCILKESDIEIHDDKQQIRIWVG